MNVRHEAHAAAQKAWREAIDNHVRTRRWDPVLVRAVNDAERWVDAVEMAEALPESYLNALHDATSAEFVELADAEGLPDIPLAVMYRANELTEAEAREAWGNR